MDAWWCVWWQWESANVLEVFLTYRFCTGHIAFDNSCVIILEKPKTYFSFPQLWQWQSWCLPHHSRPRMYAKRQGMVHISTKYTLGGRSLLFKLVYECLIYINLSNVISFIFWTSRSITPYIEKQATRFRKPLPSERRLAIFLYHVALGAPYTAISNQFGCGKTTISNIIGGVTQAILFQLGEKYTRFSTISEAMRSMEFWRAKSGIPGIVACIDGCHIPIIKPSNSGVSYCNRKGFYSINVQGMPSYEFTELLSRCRPQKAICGFSSWLARFRWWWSNMEQFRIERTAWAVSFCSPSYIRLYKRNKHKPSDARSRSGFHPRGFSLFKYIAHGTDVQDNRLQSMSYHKETQLSIGISPVQHRECLRSLQGPLPTFKSSTWKCQRWYNSHHQTNRSYFYTSQFPYRCSK